MISPQIISVSSTSLGLQNSLTPSTAMLRSAGGLSHRPRPHKQIRTFRIGLWSSYLDPSFQKEVQRRHRIVKHKYIEALNRRLSWDRQLPIHARQFGFKGFMCSAWRGQDRRPGGRWVNVEELEVLQSTQMNKEGGIEDVEQSPVDRLLMNHKNRMDELIRTRSRLFGYGWGHSEFVENKPEDTMSPNVPAPPSTETPAQSSIYGKDGFKRRFQGSSSTSEAEYEIDPITNRKVFKNQTSESPESTHRAIDIPVKPFRGYQSQFQNLSPPRTSDSALESLKVYEKEGHKPIYFNEPDGKPLEKPDPVQEGLGDYDNRATYKAVRYNEPDGKPPEKPCPVQEGLKEYDAKASYGPVWHNEPDGKAPEKPCPVQEGLKEYDAKVSYGPVMHKEPDGKDPEKPCPVRESLKDYDSKANYGAPKRSLQNKIKQFLGGASTTSAAEFYSTKEDTTEDLDLLRPSDVRAASGVAKETRKESNAEKISTRRQLEDDFYRPQGLETLFEEEKAAEKVKETRKLVEELRIEHSELLNHAAHARAKINAKIADVEAGWPESPNPRKMTGNFVRDFPGEFEATWTAEKSDSGTLTPTKTDPWGYDINPKGLEFPYRRQVENNALRAEKEPTDGLSSEEASAGRPGIKRIQPSLDRSATPKANELSEADRLEIERDPYSKEPIGLETSYEDECTARRLEAERDPYSKEPQGLETSYADECAQMEAEKRARLQAAEVDPYSKEPQGLETSYANECAKVEAERDERLKAAEIDPYSKVPQGLETSYAQECAAKQGEGDSPMFTSSYGTPKAGEGPEPEDNLSETSRSAEELEKKKHKELVREVRRIYEDAYGTIDCNHRQVPARLGENNASPTAEAEVPTLYKILAYDPTMQSISEAETTSIVTDSASPLTPAEVLLRLSNPAKFFPHFAPLQSQGYEIVSGSGDVLVFRKVRSGAPPKPLNEPTFASKDYKRRGMNPIDGMQPIAATGNFASPTGFVNHDLLEPSDPPFKSNIDVRREEPVFSGKSNWQDGEEVLRKKGGRSKRFLIGAVWVGACTYAVGVVAEYFKTGGMDGLGPKGF